MVYTAFNQNEDDVETNHDNDKLTGVDEEDKEDESNDDYYPEQDNDIDLEDKDNNDNDVDNDDSNGATEIEVMGENANVDGESGDDEEISGVDDKTQGVVNTEETWGVEDETPENEADPVKIEEKSTEHTSGDMNLLSQSHTNYNHNNYN